MSDKRLNLVQVATESLVKDLTTALSVDPRILVELAGRINTSRGLQLNDDNRSEVLGIWAATGMPVERLKDVLGVIAYLFRQATQNEVSVEDLLKEIHSLCTAKDIPGFESRESALRAMLSPSEAYLRRQRFLPFAQGAVRNLKSISAVVEMRAAFATRDSTELVGFVPVLVVRLTCSFDQDEEEQCVRFSFQVTERGLAKLIRDLEGYQKQLASAKTSISLAAVCFEDLDETDALGSQ